MLMPVNAPVASMAVTARARADHPLDMTAAQAASGIVKYDDLTR